MIHKTLPRFNTLNEIYNNICDWNFLHSISKSCIVIIIRYTKLMNCTLYIDTLTKMKKGQTP